jgi:pimeloyl-ACP methyl ester carboxylesterase
LGEGKPLVILHGLFGMSDNWLTHAKHFAEIGFEVHAIDQRNHGQSPDSDEFSYQLMSDDLFEYLTENKIAKTSIIGHSMGGKVAMLFACQHADMVDKLIVVDIAPKSYPLHHQQILAGLNALDFKTITSRREADLELAKHIANAAIRQFLLKSLYWKSREELALRFNLKAIENNIDMVGKKLPESYVFDGETLFVRGEASNYITDDDEELIHHHFPFARIHSIPGAGHWVHAEAAEEFSETTSRFLLGMYV